MKTINEVIERLNECNIQVDEYKEGKKLCGYELNTYTNGGVNLLVFIDFRNTNKRPKNASHFIELYYQYLNDFDIDNEIDVHREMRGYKKEFTLAESIQDFTDWKTKLQNIFTEPKKSKSAQRQLEQVQDKFRSLLAEMEETLKLMPYKGNTSNQCQRITISSVLRELDRNINGIELEDFTPNEYSGDFKLSYS